VGNFPVRLSIPGTFNVYNALAALCLGLALEISPEAIVRGLAEMHGVTGRMQRVDEGQPFTVLVDYAHTPEAFETVLGMLRPAVKGRMIAVFGSAGERDREKRPMQGAIAARYADFLILTDEDPRLEDREAILAEIATGVEQLGKRKGQHYLCIPDRREAIRAALEAARPGDMVLLLGKGHEGCIFYADYALPWDEAGVAREILREMGFRKAPLQQ
jgi:UDP-N-acetylmuramoyl-L-alanyl-D-glutamate--2,6-diaminopimelate ligase